MSKKTYFLLAGEPSGDRLGAFLSSGLTAQGHQCVGWGGPKMKAAGTDILHDMSDLGLMGWSSVITQLPKQVSLLRKAKEDIKKTGADRLILIDYGSFNLRIAVWAKQQNIHVIYYSPPKIWASRPKRIRHLKDCDKVIVLFPFEQEYYRSRGLETVCYGHPLAEDIVNFEPDPSFESRYNLDESPMLGIFPGSRKEEIKTNLPVYLKAANKLHKYQVLISAMPSSQTLIEEVLHQEHMGVPYRLIQHDDYHNLMRHADIAMITSGTASWEAALHGVPQVVGYRTSQLNYLIAKQLITVPYISLVNLMMGRLVVPECIQDELTTTNLLENIIRLESSETKSEINNSYENIRRMSYMSHIIKNTMVAITT